MNPFGGGNWYDGFIAGVLMVLGGIAIAVLVALWVEGRV